MNEQAAGGRAQRAEGERSSDEQAAGGRAQRAEGERSSPKRDHGWWPYFLPMLAFLLIVQVESQVPEGAVGVFLVLKAALPGALLAYYASRGSYPELSGYRENLGGIGLDIGIGLLGAAIWMAPYLLFASLRPDADDAFDPELMGPGFVGLVLALRAIGYGVVTPFVEELFVRSFVQRLVDSQIEWRDFRSIPIARFSWPSFGVVLVYFTFSHVPWEWPVAFAWVLLTQLWFYHRRHLISLVIVHATSNLAILAAVAAAPGGNLWFFV